jgi:hypothetical protein
MWVDIMGFRGMGTDCCGTRGSSSICRLHLVDVYINGNPVVDLLEVREAVQKGGNDFC